MIYYICKYTPVELLAAMDEPCRPLFPQVSSMATADRLIHANVCSFSRALLEDAMQGGKRLLLTDCCDSVRRVYDVLRAQGLDVLWLDLPHNESCCGKLLFKQQLLRLLTDCQRQTGRRFDADKFRAALQTSAIDKQGGYIAVLGARINPELVAEIEKISPLPLLDLTCSGGRRLGQLPPDLDLEDMDKLMTWYAGELLAQIPCMRMENIGARRALVNDPHLRGIIYHTVKFCDYYGLEYARLKEELPLPVLQLESDWSQQNKGQISTRLQAFFEALPQEEKKNKEKENKEQKRKSMDGKKYTVGIDIGSTSTNVVILQDGQKVAAAVVLPTGVKGALAAKQALQQALSQAGISEGDIANTVTTGYGRANITFRGQDVTEITCHARGAAWLRPDVRTVIDIGGQDSKVISLSEGGKVKDFVMNDKCAAGTGRFLEMMAHSLQLPLAEMSQLGLTWDEDITISSMCSVFAESEVISLLADNKKLPDIVHGINKAVAAKIFSLLQRLGLQEPYMMTGGVAYNTGVVQAIESLLGQKLVIDDNPQICGALGAAVIAADF